MFSTPAWAEPVGELGAIDLDVVPTTKHHDGIAFWNAPGTRTRNTVHRGLIADLATATRARGLRFGIYSGGLDWDAGRRDLPGLFAAWNPPRQSAWTAAPSRPGPCRTESWSPQPNSAHN
ncbi:alpha-L-fucosidase [Nonomuraea sp. NPDC000554]|uniref:alpha-L-fucosidase n=1 Tax=Nonomuraea sp. NPDC000554 TaxID=3154259 RepID=UPI00332D52B5